MFQSTFSSGCPFFSYMASKKAGTMTNIMTRAAELTPILFLSKKKSGTPITAPAEKQMSCRCVRLKSTLLLILERSLGTLTYAMGFPP